MYFNRVCQHVSLLWAKTLTICHYLILINCPLTWWRALSTALNDPQPTRSHFPTDTIETAPDLSSIVRSIQTLETDRAPTSYLHLATTPIKGLADICSAPSRPAQPFLTPFNLCVTTLCDLSRAQHPQLVSNFSTCHLPLSHAQQVWFTHSLIGALCTSTHLVLQLRPRRVASKSPSALVEAARMASHQPCPSTRSSAAVHVP